MKNTNSERIVFKDGGVLYGQSHPHEVSAKVPAGDLQIQQLLQRRLKEIQVPTGIELVPLRLVFGLKFGSGAHFSRIVIFRRGI